MKQSKATRPRHRRPDHEKGDPASEYFVPNDPGNRQAGPRQERPRVHRKTRLEVLAAEGEDRKYQERLEAAARESQAHPEATECPLCGLTPIQALMTKQRPALIIRPGWVVCSCRREAIDVAAITKERKAALAKERRMILDCFMEDANRYHEPGSESKSKTRDKPIPAQSRMDREWHGYPTADPSETAKLEKLVVVIKGKIPRVLRDRLKAEARKFGRYKESHVFRWLLSQHLGKITESFEVEYGGDTVMVELLVTRQHADLWAAVKVGLSTEKRRVSNADLIAAVMLEEWHN